MKVIPVIDILNGRVVHAVRGERSVYQPIKSILTQSVDPVEIAEVFHNVGFNNVYVADLDAIISCSTDFQLLKRIADETDLELLVDAGITSIERARLLLDSGVSKLIVGTESLQKKRFVENAIRQFGSDCVLISLDLRGEKVIVKLGFDGCVSPMCLLRDFKAMGVSKVIVLDLNRVGSGEGVNKAFLKRIIDETQIEVYVGGGVRNLEDLLELQGLGISGALVATALHSGKISVDELRKSGFL